MYIFVLLRTPLRVRVLLLLAFEVSKKPFMSILLKLSIYAPFGPLRYRFWCVKWYPIEGGWTIPRHRIHGYSLLRAVPKVMGRMERTRIRPLDPCVCLKWGVPMPKKVLIALPPAMLEQVDFIAKCEHRTRSDLIREALRRYLDNFKRTQGAQLSVSTMEVSEKPLTPSLSWSCENANDGRNFLVSPIIGNDEENVLQRLPWRADNRERLNQQKIRSTEKTGSGFEHLET